MIAVEARLERSAGALAGAAHHFVAGTHVYRALEAAAGRGLVLSTEPRHALGRITDRDRLASVVGHAGSGQSATPALAPPARAGTGSPCRGAAFAGHSPHQPAGRA